MKTKASFLGVVLALSSFLSFPSGHATTAVPGEDQWVYCGDMVTLDGSQSLQAETFHWEQIITGEEPVVTLSDPDPPNGIVTFTPSPREIGYVLTFRLTVTGPGGTDSADTHVNARANNPPKLAPQNVRVLPLDLGAQGLGFRPVWDPVFDAEEYDIGLKFGWLYIWLETSSRTSFEVGGMVEGMTRVLGIRGRNKFGAPDDYGPYGIADVSYTAVPNLSLPTSLGGKAPPLAAVQGQTYVVSHYDIAGMNNRAYDDHNDSYDGSFKDGDFWGYLWTEPLFFDHIVYFTGNMFQDGGWFTSLKVQWSVDGVTWNDAPILEIYPGYDFTDNPAGKQSFTRYDIFIPTLHGKGIRIYGAPGGTATFTSMAELEVFGHQTGAGPVIQAIGLDAAFDEGTIATLDGSQSSSTSGPIVQYEWGQVVGREVAIQNLDAAVATFQVPLVDKDELLVFSLTVSDGTNQDVDDDVRIIVRNVEVPTTKADAGPDQIVFEGDPVTLDGSASTSASGSLTYLWTQTGGRDAGVTGSTTAVVTFTAPVVGDTTEELTFRLQVDDGLGQPDSVSTDEVIVEVRKSEGAPPTAVPGEDQWVYCGDMVRLDGSQSVQAEIFHWEQVITGEEPVVTLSNPDPPNGITTFTPPPREIGYVLTFRLTVTGPGGTDSADTDVNARANNPPKLAPQNVRVLPLDQGPAGLGYRLVWDALFDAEEYEIAIKVGEEHLWLESIAITSYDVKGLAEGQTRTIGIRGRNKFGASDDPAAIADVSATGVRNLAVPVSLGGKTPPLPPVQGQTYVVSHYDIAGMNDRAYDDHNDSWNGSFKDEDFWGYLWSEPLFFDHIVYFSGDMFSGGGWFTSLKVQYSVDGATWNDATILEIYPEYDFTDDAAGKQPFTRYDIFIPVLRGKGIRIHGTPGGTASFTSIAELEVFGDQTQPGTVIQAIGRDAEFQEGSTATLDGSQSSSTAGPIVEYEWEQVSGPAVTIQGADGAIATLEAPMVDQDEVLVFSLRVSDGTDEDVDDDVRITVRNVEVPETKADAGPDQIVFEGDPVTLDGSASTSASGSLTYLWTQTGGSDAGVTGSTTAVVTFSAPIVADTTEELTFQLQVDDGLGQPDSVSTDEVVVEVRKSEGGPPTAVPGEDQWVYCGDMVTLDGSQSLQAETFHWEQIITGDEPLVTLSNPDPPNGVTTFTPPPREIGYVLTFRLFVTGPGGTDSADTHVNARANNPPKLAPQNIRVLPLDLGAAGLGFRLVWDPLFDAESYQIAIELAGSYFWLESISRTSYDVKGLAEGQVRSMAIRGASKFGASDDPAAIAGVSATAMRNLSPPASLGGKTPPLPPVQGETYVVSHYDIAGMNNRAYDDHNDSWNGSVKDEDFWGYLWSEPLFFDHIVYFTGNMFQDGGWFTSLKVQWSVDGVAWSDAPILEIYPEYDFTDDRSGKQAFTRYDIFIPTLRGKGIRICGAPGGIATFTSIAELEVFGLQTQGPLIVQGIDAEYPEGGTAILDGSLTFSTAGPITSYQWTGPGGITIANLTLAVTFFHTPYVTEDTVYVFGLEASDGTNIGRDDDVRILVKNLATTAVAGPDQSVQEGSQVFLDGTASVTTTGYISYFWTQVGGLDVGITGKTTPTVTFTAPTIWAYEEPLTFRLDVDDGAGGISSDDVVVTVMNTVAWPAYPLDEAEGTLYLKNLLHLGENPTDRILSPLDINSDLLSAFGGQARQKPYPGLEYDFAGTGVTVTQNPMRWTPIFDETGFFGDEPIDEFQQVYHVYILSPEARQARFHFRHDDEIRGWNNGILVINRDGWDTMSDQVEDFVLDKGLNSITLKFHEAAGPSYLAVGITTLTDESWGDLLYSLGPSLVLTDVYASRSLPDSFGKGETVNVSLSVRVNPANVPASVTVVENIPAGVPESNVSAPGAVIMGGKITWNLTGPLVKHQTLSYSVTVPTKVSDALHFSGTLTFGATTVDIQGDKTVYPLPSAPRSLTVEMLQAAHLSWAAPLTEGAVSYNVYRVVNGGAYELIANTTNTAYTDKWISAGNNYAYRVSAVNVVNDVGPLSRPTAHLSMPMMDIREAEDFDYGGGQYPGFENCPAANEAPSATDLDPQYDFYHPNTGGPNDYRPANVTPNGLGIETVEEADDPGVFHTNIGWVDVGSWYRYTYNVPQAGWVTFEFRVASPYDATLAAYWDETFVGTVSYNTGNWHIFTWALMEDQIQTTAGVHTLRVEFRDGGTTLDKHAIQWNAAPPARQSIWEDSFDSYTSTADVFSPTIGKWTRGNTTYTDGSWTLWDTAGPNLGGEAPNIAGMEDKYMISDSDLSGAGVLLDEEMLSPEVDCTEWTRLRLNFNYNYRVYDDPENAQTAQVDVRWFDPPVGWTNWTSLLHLDVMSVPAGLDPPILSDPEEFDLSAYDGKNIQLKFHFYDAEYDYWFAVDQIRVSGVRMAPPPPQADIGKDGDTVSVGWEEFGDGQYTVEYADDLNPGEWQIPPGDWPTNSMSWTDNDISSTTPRRFYRVESDGIRTDPVGFVRVEALRGSLTMISVPVAAADNRLNGEPGCIGDMIKENLVGGPDPSVADLIWKWDAGKQSYVTAFLADGTGEAYDGRWVDPATGKLSTMTLYVGEAFWLQRR